MPDTARDSGGPSPLPSGATGTIQCRCTESPASPGGHVCQHKGKGRFLRGDSLPSDFFFGKVT